MVMSTASPSSFGGHHARLGLNLDFRVDLEVAMGRNKLSLLQTVLDEIVVACPHSQDDFSSLIRCLIRRRELFVQLVHCLLKICKGLLRVLDPLHSLPSYRVFAQSVCKIVPELPSKICGGLIIGSVQQPAEIRERRADIFCVALFHRIGNRFECCIQPRGWGGQFHVDNRSRTGNQCSRVWNDQRR